MSPRLAAFVLMLTVLLAGCGSASRTSTAGAPLGTPSKSRTTGAGSAATGDAATATLGTAGATGGTATATTTSSASGSVSTVTKTTGPGASTTSGRPAPGSARTSPPPPRSARIPATFTIESGGALSPGTISAPVGIAVELTVISRDGAAHTVTVKPATLHVPAHGHASILLRRLRVGAHPVKLDSRPRGVLEIGAAPGP